MNSSNKILITAIILLSLLTFATAEEEVTIDENIHEEVDLDEIQAEVNNSQEEVPDFVANIAGDEDINVHFEDSGQVYSTELEGTEINEINEEEMENPTLEVRVNESSSEAILESEQPLEELQNQLDEGNIEYEALTTENRIRMFITETVLDIMSRIGVL